VIVYECIASSLYSGRMLKSFRLVGAVRISSLHCHALNDIARFLAITGTLAANGLDLPGRVASGAGKRLRNRFGL